MFATSGSVARVVGPLLVTEIYEQWGTYVMFGTVTATLVISLAVTLFSYKTLVPATHGQKKDDNKTDDENKVDTIVPSVPEMIVNPTMKKDNATTAENKTESAPKEIGKRLPIFSEEDEEESDK